MYELRTRQFSFFSRNIFFKFLVQCICSMYIKSQRSLHINIGIRRCTVDHTFSSYKKISINDNFLTFLNFFAIFFFSGYDVGEWLEEDPLSPFLNSLVFSQHRVCSLQGRQITVIFFAKLNRRIQIFSYGSETWTA
jgi:hypothetical protein